jgi:isoleucyl-tRNA synthetase
MDAIRGTALEQIEEVAWIPANGKNRIRAAVEGRPDWCISRQRTWGVPIALFVHKSTSEPHPRSVELMELVAQRVEREGADAWYAIDTQELLGEDAEHYEKVRDILDVWFDSGVTHFCVLDQRANLARKAGDKVMYLEGSDQHRGWFHSSLLTSVAMHGHAPYDEVLTHGFTVDAQGRKMSKSLGNGIEPQDVMKNYGADILRLWIASADYRNEMALSDEILKRVADAYRRIRNTARFLLGNLHGFDPAQHLVAVEDSLLLDQWAVQQAYDTQQSVIAAYSKYDFPEIVQRIQNFCTNELGSLYLDVTKDRLYTMQENSQGRRSAQSAMYRILEAMVRWLAPILSFTAEEIWPLIPGARGESVLFETWYGKLNALQSSAAQRQFWDQLAHVRLGVGGVLESLRKAGRIGASLDAELDLYLAEPLYSECLKVADELRFFFIVSDVKIHLAPNNVVFTGPDFLAITTVEVRGTKAGVFERRSENLKCIRCWHHRPDIGVDPENPDICGRCVSNLPGHPGEHRQFF